METLKYRARGRGVRNMNSKERKGTPIDTSSKEATQIQNLKDRHQN